MKPLLLWGGTDIDARLYEEKRSRFADSPNTVRDNLEWEDLESAVADKQPVIGVCRGAQLICAFNGGTLYQHSEGHNCSHDIHTKDGHVFKNVAADHHQIMKPEGSYDLLAFGGKLTKVWINDYETATIVMVPEVVYYPETKMLAIQPHPEWDKGTPFNDWLNVLIKQLFNEEGVF